MARGWWSWHPSPSQGWWPKRCVFVSVLIIGGPCGSRRAEMAQRGLHNHAATTAVKEVSCASGHHVWWYRYLVDDENRPGDLRRPATTALQHDYGTVFDQFATPHTGHLTALEGAGEA